MNTIEKLMSCAVKTAQHREWFAQECGNPPESAHELLAFATPGLHEFAVAYDSAKYKQVIIDLYQNDIRVTCLLPQAYIIAALW